MSYLHYFFIVNFTLRIYQSYGFLPFPLRKLIEIRNTVMDTNYYTKNNTDKGSLGPVSTLFKASRTNLKLSGKHLSKVPTRSFKSKPFNRNRYANEKTKLKDSLSVSYAGTTGDTTNTQYYYDVPNKTLEYILITDDYSQENDITRTLPQPVIGITRAVNENDITRTIPLSVIDIKRTINENDKTRTVPLPVIGITRTVHENEKYRTVPLPVIGITRTVNDITLTRTLPQPSILKHNTALLPIPKATIDNGPNEKVTLEANRTHTGLDSDEIGPIRVLIADDTDVEPNYISFTKRPHKIAFFDVTKKTVEDDESYDTPDDWFVVRRTSPYDGLHRVTRTSPDDGLYRVTRPSQFSTVYRVRADKSNFQSHEYNDYNDSNSDSEYNFESDFYEKDDVSVSPSAFATKQHSWQEQHTWAYEEFPETEDDTGMSSSRTRQMTTLTQVSYGNKSMSNENYSSYALNSTWLTFTIRNYFAQFVTTQTRSTATTDAIRRFDPAQFTSSPLPTNNDKNVTMQIKHLTGAIMYSRSRKIGRPKKLKGRRLKKKTIIPKAVKDPWECYDCGMNETEFGQPDCSNIFESPNQIERYLKKNLTKKCNGSPKYHGQCFTRYLDVGNNYNERGCRTYPPATGRSYASRKFMRLEYLLKQTEDGCVTSPRAVLLPFNKGIQLYVRFHVCVCKGRKCNDARPIVFNWTTSLSIILYFVI